MERRRPRPRRLQWETSTLAWGLLPVTTASSLCSFVSFVVKRFSDHGDVSDHARSQRSSRPSACAFNSAKRPPTPPFYCFVANKTFSPIVAWLSLARRLGDPCVTLG